MTEELKKEIMDILDNVRYWETCPEDYKVRIKAISEQLIIGGVSERLFTKIDLMDCWVDSAILRTKFNK